MKKYVSIILAILAVISMLAGCSQKNNTPADSNIQEPAESTSAGTPAAQGDSLSKEDYQKLSELQFAGYENMTVSEYQKKVQELTGKTEYKDLLARFFADERLFRMRNDDDTAAFVFYVLEPLTSENWQRRDFSGVTDSGSTSGENAFVEYTYTLNVLNADHARVKDYVSFGLKLRQEILQPILQNATTEELRDEKQMRKKIDTYLTDELSRMQTSDLSATVKYDYLRLYEEDYRSLLTLKTTDYEKMTLAAFDAALQSWVKENPEIMDRIAGDLVRTTFALNLDEKETAFVTNTIFLSYIENGGYAQSSSGQKSDKLVFENFPQKAVTENGADAWYSLHYEFTYRVSDPNSVTVGERDTCISKMRNAVYTLWDGTDLEELMKMSSQDLSAKLQTFAEKYSTESITISVGKDPVQFERMDAQQAAK